MSIGTEIGQAFAVAGWRKVIVERAIGYCKTLEKSETVTIEIATTTLPDKIRVDLFWFLESIAFSEICQKIFLNKARMSAPIFTESENLYFALGQQPDDVQFNTIVDKVTAWQKTCNSVGFIADLANSPIPLNGQQQLFHLAALASTGDFNTLMDYQEIFRRSKKLNFVPMISDEMIDRALEIALEKAE